MGRLHGNPSGLLVSCSASLLTCVIYPPMFSSISGSFVITTRTIIMNLIRFGSHTLYRKNPVKVSPIRHLLARIIGGVRHV